MKAGHLIVFLLFVFPIQVFTSPTSYTDSASYYLDRVKSQLPSTDALQMADAEKAENFARQSANDSLLIMAWYLKGVLYYYSGYYNASNTYYKKALEYPALKKYPGLAYRILNNSGINYDLLGKPVESLKYYLEAIKYPERDGNQKGVAQININIGRLYRVSRDFEKSEDYLFRARDFFVSTQDTFYLGLVAQNLASLYADMRKGESEVKEAFNKALAFYQQLNYHYGLVELWHNLGDYYLKVTDEHNKASVCFEEALAMSRKNNLHENSTHLLLALAKIDMAKGNYRQAEKYALESVELAKSQNIQSSVLAASRMLAEIYIDLGNNKEALNWFRQFEASSDSLYNLKKTKSFNELSVAHDIDSKNQQIEKQQLELRNYSLREKWLISSLIFGILAVGMLVYFMHYRTVRLRRQYMLNRQLFEKGKAQQKQVTVSDEHIEKHPATGSHVELFSKITIYLTENKDFSNPDMSVSEVAEKLNTNQNYISHAVNENAGMNFSNFLNQLRVEEARSLIEENGKPGLSLEQIMNRSGFRSRTTFTEAFKKFTGMTPGQYQKFAKEK